MGLVIPEHRSVRSTDWADWAYCNASRPKCRGIPCEDCIFDSKNRQQFNKWRKNMDNYFMVKGEKIEMSEETANAMYDKFKTKKLNGWERVKKGATYWHRGFTGIIHSHIEFSQPFDQRLFDNCNYFSTREKAEEVNKVQLPLLKIRRWIDKHDNVELDWKSVQQNKYTWIYYHPCEQYQIVVHSTNQYTGKVYFSSKILAKQCMEELREEYEKLIKKQKEILT